MKKNILAELILAESLVKQIKDKIIAIEIELERIFKKIQEEK